LNISSVRANTSFLALSVFAKKMHKISGVIISQSV